MIYEYVCDMCGNEWEITKHSRDAGREEICEECKVTLRRIYRPIGLNFLTLTQREKGDVQRYRSDTGNDLVCVGDDRKAVEAIAPKLAEYDLPPDVERAVHQGHLPEGMING